jgi:uncharacterized protein (DUF58 family)
MNTNPPDKISSTIIGNSFWGLTAISAGLLVSRWLFDEIFFLNALYLIGFYLLLSFVYTFFSLDGISIQRKTRYQRKQVGDLFEETIQITNHFVIPVIWLQISDLSEIGQSHSFRVIGMIPGRQTRLIRESSILLKRGIKKLSPMEVFTSDPLGCFHVKRTFETEGQLTVLPYRKDLSAHNQKNRKSEDGKSSIMSLNQTTMNTSIRTYQPGDPLNRIHWLTTAKKGTLHSKSSENPIQKLVWICMDCQKEVHYREPVEIGFERIGFLDAAKINWKYSLPCDTMETAVSITSSLAITYLKRGYSLGLALNQNPKEILLPDVGLRQLSAVLDALTVVQANSHYPEYLMLKELSSRLSGGGLLVLVSPDDSKELSAQIQNLSQSGLEIQRIYINRNSYDGKSTLNTNNRKIQTINQINFQYGDDLTKLMILF